MANMDQAHNMCKILPIFSYVCYLILFSQQTVMLGANSYCKLIDKKTERSPVKLSSLPRTTKPVRYRTRI